MKRFAILLVAASLASASFAQDTGSIVGAGIGAALGNKVGDGKGRTLAIIAGAAAGAAVGGAVSNPQQSRPQTYHAYADNGYYEQRATPAQYNQPRPVGRQCEYVYYQGQTLSGNGVTMVGCACLDRALGAMKLTDQIMYCEGR